MSDGLERHKAARLRRWAKWGATRGPRALLWLAPAIFGPLFVFLIPKARRAVLRNQRRLFGKRGLVSEWRGVFATFIQFASCLIESLAPHRDGQAERGGRVLNAERVLPLLGHEKGFIVLTAHVGPWDAAAQALAGIAKKELLLVMNDEQDQAAADLQDSVRRHAGLKVVRLGTDPLSALPLLNHLSEGGIVALQMDRAPRERAAVVAELKGAPFPVPAGPFILAGLAGVSVLPIFSAREGFFRRRIEVGVPIAVGAHPGVEALKVAAGEALGQLERHLLGCPDQWFHFVDDEEEAEGLRAALAWEQRPRRRRRQAASSVVSSV